MGMTRRVAIALAVGLTLTGIAVIVVLARSPLTVAGTNSVPAANYIEITEKNKLSSCQSSGTIPQGTSAIRLGMEGVFFSPAVTLKVLMGSHIIREGHRVGGGASAPTVTVPVSSLAHAVRGAQICMTVGPAVEPIRYYGAPNRSPVPHANQLQQAILQIEYLRPGKKSWWSFASPIARHLGLGRAPSGTWVAFLVLVLMLAVILAASWLTVEELR
jgi:hypothetical protein